MREEEEKLRENGVGGFDIDIKKTKKYMFFIIVGVQSIWTINIINKFVGFSYTKEILPEENYCSEVAFSQLYYLRSYFIYEQI